MEPCSNCPSLCLFFVTEPKSSYGSARRKRAVVLWSCCYAGAGGREQSSKWRTAHQHCGGGELSCERAAALDSPRRRKSSRIALPEKAMHAAALDSPITPQVRHPCCAALAWGGGSLRHHRRWGRRGHELPDLGKGSGTDARFGDGEERRRDRRLRDDTRREPWLP
jgi:hypothetical protein